MSEQFHRGTERNAPLAHEQDPLVSEEVQARQTREAEERQRKEEHAQSVLEARDVVRDVLEEESANNCSIE